MCLICAVGLFIFQKQELQADLENLQQEHGMQAELEELSLLRHLSIVMRDLRFFANHPLLKELSANPTPESVSTMTEIMRTFSEVTGIYDQMRWIDANGMERIRINFSSNGAVIVPNSDLQYKGDRPYVIESVGLNEGVMHMSPLDLNVENGEIELPQKPVLRFAMPIFDKQGARQGVVVLNYLANVMLDEFSSAMTSSEQTGYILNAQGYWLRGPRNDLEWGFMFNNGITLGQQNPELWRAISAQESGAWNGESGFWVWRTAHPEQGLSLYSTDLLGLQSLDSHNESWKVVIYTSAEQIADIEWQIRSRLLAFSCVLFVVLVLLSWYISNLTCSRKIAWQNLEELAKKDGLTGLLNHRAFMEQVETLWSHWVRRQDIPISVVALDLDHFKRVNDTYGHQTGDDVLKGFSEIIRSNLRKTDIAGRTGGEEFAVVLFDCDARSAALFAERIREQMQAAVFHHGNNRVNITVSLGIALFASRDTSPFQALERADQALYKAKQNGRNRVEM